MIRLTQDTFSEALSQASVIIRDGGIVLCPTDTAYMLAADALNERAIRRIHDIKRRPRAMGLTVIVQDLAMASIYVVVTQQARSLASSFLPGPLTMVLAKRANVPHLLTGGRDTLGIRIPDDRFALSLSGLVDGAITATSANATGRATPHTLSDALDALGPGEKLLDLMIDGGSVATPGVSTIVDLTGPVPRVLRAGLLPAARLLEAASHTPP